MSSRRLDNYLRTFRRRSAFSQEEIAYLLGAQSGAKISRYERFTREPCLETALAYEAIFLRSVSELFPGFYEKIEAQVRARAKALLVKIGRGDSNALRLRKQKALKEILGIQAEN